MPGLFEPVKLRDVVFRNRAWVSPMCMYSSSDGLPNDFHLVHLGSFARGGAGLVMSEATGVCPDGRITPACAGLWSGAHVDAYRRITAFIEEQGSIPGIQLAHAGRKGSTSVQWEGSTYLSPTNGGWLTMGPSPLAFGNLPAPRQMTLADISSVVTSFAESAALAVAAGFGVVEIHAAHGYLIHQFLSPLANKRTDAYGGSLDNRIRLALDIARAVRAALPVGVPLLFRVSATDWADGGWNVDETQVLAAQLRDLGVDMIDCSTGALLHEASIDVYEGYQVPFARSIRESALIATAAVGLITDPRFADEIVGTGAADAVFLGRALLRNPHWPLEAAEQLGGSAPWPVQYLGARRKPSAVTEEKSR